MGPSTPSPGTELIAVGSVPQGRSVRPGPVYAGPGAAAGGCYLPSMAAIRLLGRMSVQDFST
ncbi:hypothetical protein HNR57_007938 [Streptomyces paradoxus]|uniref:Uncharacterized protein n=1 Tax=Streptomyces paradoxus TaxID=66375 RepID=A0A7W9TJS3_9ACTN|nr:hypothetical protein [Streptomyces paradoxus]